MKREDITDAMVVKACHLSHQTNLKMSSQILQEETGAPIKVIYAAMERADGRGLIEWGVSLRTAWPTDKGMELIKAKL